MHLRVFNHARDRFALLTVTALDATGSSPSEATTNNVSPESDCCNMNMGSYSTQ